MATRRTEQVERTREPAGRGGEANGAFTLDEVKALVKVLEGTDVTSLRWDRNGQQLVIRRGQAPVFAPAFHAPAPLAPPVAHPPPAAAHAAAVHFA